MDVKIEYNLQTQLADVKGSHATTCFRTRLIDALDAMKGV
jgi:hypothetical protein